jgi:ectoine hydroxylase-related dioxygenase (phytanoyl-CoA dioxygenase family)
MLAAEIATGLERDGFTLISQLFGRSITDKLIYCLTDSATERSQRAGETYGARNLFGLEPIRAAAKFAALSDLLASTMGEDTQAVRAIYFDKTQNANWPVAWHQDLSLALSERRELPGWNNWTVKRGVPHVQAPRAVLERMVTVRVHLDDCPAENGALRVIAGSHRYGIFTRDQLNLSVQSEPSVVIAAKAGDSLLMKPLLLHASSPAQKPSHRRVLHLEFAPAGLLPDDLSWAETA